MNIIRDGEYDIKKEAIWAVCNLTDGGTREQVITAMDAVCRLMLDHATQSSKGAIAMLCISLQLPDARILRVALDGTGSGFFAFLHGS
jgi:hypothetical protein